MKIEFGKNMIKFEKELNDLDKFVLDFVSVLKKMKIKYVIISGYVPILFGRPRVTEDVDIFIDKINFEKFVEFVNVIRNNGYEIVNSPDAKELYYDYLKENIGIRVYKGRIYPNMEIKFVKKERINELALERPLKIIVNEKELLISSIEQQIAYKLLLGSRKDVEDAYYLFNLFKDKLDIKKLRGFNKLLGVEKTSKRHLGV